MLISLLASLAARSHWTRPIKISFVALSLKATCACANRKPPKPGRRRRVFIGANHATNLKFT
jgi:hypothetical protein